MSTLFDIWLTTQTRLFPWLQERLDPLSEKEERFVQVVSLMDLSKHMREYRWIGIGRKREDRASIAKAFVAKAVYKVMAHLMFGLIVITSNHLFQMLC
jgi:DNA segregation ATPase FtsK/SpoIIIE-like protein